VAVAGGGGFGRVQLADGLLFAAVAVCALAYAEGGILSRSLGAWQTISWALVVAAPVMLVLTIVAVSDRPPVATPTEWLCFAYLGSVSMFLGFVAWYRGLAIGPLAQVSQIQLLQPVLSIGWAALLLGETVSGWTVLGGAAVLTCALVAVRIRSISPTRPRPDRRRPRKPDRSDGRAGRAG
ncbi:DMT family transporter, partial [Microbacterium gorillae]|uniref:DMT family transporter n=1 Tax=Microbacterium gorillae TaxID=1231063 RepID=UPI00114450EA